MKKRLFSYIASLLIIISFITPVCATDIKAGDEVLLGGMPFGVKFFSGNMTVSGFTEVESENGLSSPAYEAGIRENDIILKLNGKSVRSAEEVTRTIENSKGNPVNFICYRNDKELTFNVTPVMSKQDGTYKVGIWIKDSTAGIGTVTYVHPDTGAFGGLGHGICNNETGNLLEIRRGIISEVSISGIEKGEVGDPGELKGYFSSGKIGVVTKNTECGIFGILTDISNKTKYNKTIKIASRDETKTGNASILCTLGDNKIKEYQIEIICDNNDNSKSNFSVVITDKSLISQTGGIVQGMSGSPIIQNGKLVGAVTHVLVNDPTRGYGIYIENMLEAER